MSDGLLGRHLGSKVQGRVYDEETLALKTKRRILVSVVASKGSHPVSCVSKSPKQLQRESNRNMPLMCLMVL